MKVVSIIFGFILLGVLEANAQTTVQVKGVPDDVQMQMEEEATSLLTAIESHDLSAFSANIVSDEFTEQVADLSLISEEGKVYTTAISFGDNGSYELKGILMSASGEKNTIRELVLVFNEDVKLTSVEFGEMLSNSAWVISRDIQVRDSKTLSMLQGMLKDYEQTFQRKDASALKELFADDGYVVSSTLSDSFDGFEVTKSSTREYIKRMETGIFKPENDLQISLGGEKFYHHPDEEGVYGITVRQTWNSSFYADQGYLFMVIDARGPQPQMYSRQWQKEPFKKVDYLEEELDPYAFQVFHKKLVSNDIPRSFDGDIEFIIDSEVPGLLTPEFIREILQDGTLSIGGVTLSMPFAEEAGENLIVPFKADAEEHDQVVETSVTFAGNKTIDPFEGTLNLYLGRRNVVVLQAGKSLEKQRSPDYLGTLNLSFNTDSVSLKIRSELGRKIVDKVVSDTTDSFELLEGTYEVYASKLGYISTQTKVVISRSEKTDQLISLESRVPVAANKEPSKGFFAKNKYWIIGGAAAVVSSTALILSTGGSDSPGIPVPPGRPGVN